MKDERLRGRHPQRHHRSAGEPVLPVSRRARPRRFAPGRHLRDQRSRARVEAVVLPLEHDPRRRAAAARHRRQTQRARRARPAGAAHAGRSAFGDAGEQLRPSMARHEAPRRDRAGLGGVPVCLRPIRSARGFPHRADALRRQHLQGRPQRGRSAEREAHVSQRARRAALRHHRRERRSLPAGRARRSRRAGGCSAKAPC